MNRYQQILAMAVALGGFAPTCAERLRSRPIEITGTHEDRGESSIRQPPPMKRLPKVGTIPGAVGGCTCPACDPDDEPEDHDDTGYPARGENVYRAPVAKGQRRITRAQRKVLNQAKQRREAPSRAEFAAWMRGVVGERSKS